MIEQAVKQEKYRRKKKSLKCFKLGTTLKATEKDRTEKYMQSGLWQVRLYKICVNIKIIIRSVNMEDILGSLYVCIITGPKEEKGK